MKKEKNLIKCQRCLYKWYPRRKIPIQCPRCKRYDYAEIKEVKE